MQIAADHQTGTLGVSIADFDAAAATEEDIAQLRDLVYEHKLVVLKRQQLSPAEYLALARRIGEPEAYYQPMYHHPEFKEIFVSSNVSQDGQQMGVPKTGKFWHSDYEFMPRPFAITMVYQHQVPNDKRGTYFIDMGRAFRRLPDVMKVAVRGTVACHSPRRYFKIRPTDVYRPIGEILEEIERESPPSRHPAVIRHPVTGEEVLYISEGLTYRIEDTSGQDLGADFMASLFAATGQLDKDYAHDNIQLRTVEQGDILVWDNRSLVHCAKHVASNAPTVSYRITLHDAQPFRAP